MTDALADKAASIRDAALTARRRVADDTEGMSYLQTLPRRLVTLYLPLVDHPASCCCSRSTGWR